MGDGKTDGGMSRTNTWLDNLMSQVEEAQLRETEALNRLNGMTLPTVTKAEGKSFDPYRPVARFRRSDGSDYPDWEPMSLGDVLVERDEWCDIDDNLQQLGVCRRQVVVNLPYREIDRERLILFNKRKHKIARDGDICVGFATLPFGGIGLNKHGTGMVRCEPYRVRNGHLPEFMELMLTRDDFLNWVESIRHDENDPVYMFNDTFLGLVVSVPSLEEQRRIVDLFSVLEKLISATADELHAIDMLRTPLLDGALGLARANHATRSSLALSQGSKVLEGMYVSSSSDSGSDRLHALGKLELCIDEAGAVATGQAPVSHAPVGFPQVACVRYANNPLSLRVGSPSTLHIRRILMGYGYDLATTSSTGSDRIRFDMQDAHMLYVAMDWAWCQAKHDFSRYDGIRKGLLHRMFVDG